MPQPIDMQTELGRATMADKIQAATDRASLAAAARAQLDSEEEQVRGETQVAETPEAEGAHVDPETKRRTPYAKRGDNPSPDDEQAEKNKPQKNDTGPHRFDVSV